MTIRTLRPDATLAVGSFAPIGAATLHAATSDDVDATNGTSPGVLFSPMVLDLTGYDLADDERVKLFQLRIRGSSGAAAEAQAQVQIASGGLDLTFTPPAWTSTAVNEITSGWSAASAEPTQDDINASALRVMQIYAQAVNTPLRIAELFVDLDVRARPTINSVTPTVTLGAAALAVRFDYHTSGITDSVRVRAVITDDRGTTIGTFDQVVEGADFDDELVTLPLGTLAPTAEYSAVVTVTDAAFPGGPFTSLPVTATFAVPPSGVNPPILECELDIEAQTVVLTIAQPEPKPPPVGNPLAVSQFALGAHSSGPFAFVVDVPAGETPHHAALWINGELAVCDITLGASNVTYAGTLHAPATLSAVVAHSGASPSNAHLASSQVAGSGRIAHNLNTTALVVQARHQSGLQATIAATIVDSDTIAVEAFGGTTVDVVIVGIAPVPENVPVTTNTIPPGGATVPMPYSAAYTLATVTDAAGNVVNWTDVDLNPANIVVENPTADDLTLHLAGTLAEFDDLDDVRVEVRRDGVRIPLDGLNGALVPNPADETSLVVVDRFAPRCSTAPTCTEEEREVHGVLYRARFYGLVNGALAYSAWSECDPGCLPHDGRALIRHPVDPTLDFLTSCAAEEPWTRSRPFGAVQSIDGGIPYVQSARNGGRDLALTIHTHTTDEALALEALLEATYVWYAPTDPARPGSWQALQSGLAFAHAHMRGRPHQVTQATIEVEPVPVLLPVIDL